MVETPRPPENSDVQQKAEQLAKKSPALRKYLAGELSGKLKNGEIYKIAKEGESPTQRLETKRDQAERKKLLAAIADQAEAVFQKGVLRVEGKYFEIKSDGSYVVPDLSLNEDMNLVTLNSVRFPIKLISSEVDYYGKAVAYNAMVSINTDGGITFSSNSKLKLENAEPVDKSEFEKALPEPEKSEPQSKAVPVIDGKTEKQSQEKDKQQRDDYAREGGFSETDEPEPEESAPTEVAKEPKKKSWRMAFWKKAVPKNRVTQYAEKR